MREVRLDSQNRVFKINQTLNCGPAPTTPVRPFLCDNPMDMEFGPDGNLYLLTYGDGFFAINRTPPWNGSSTSRVFVPRWPCCPPIRRPDRSHSPSTSRARARLTPTRATRSGSSGTSTATARSTRSIPTRRHVYTTPGSSPPSSRSSTRAARWARPTRPSRRQHRADGRRSTSRWTAARSPSAMASRSA